MPELLLLQPDARSRARLREALGGAFSLRSVANWREVERRARRGDPLGCILDVFAPSEGVPIPTLRKFARKHPSVALIVCSDFSDREMELYHLGRVSVHGVLRLEENPAHRRIRTVVEEALAASLAEMVVRSAARDLPPLAQEALRWAIEHAAARPQVSDLAAALALSPRALHRESRTMNLAPPRTLLLWGRLIHATHLLERRRGSVEGVAFGLGYATGGALRKALKRHVGCSPTTLLRRGGLAWTLEEFQRKGLHRGRGEGERWANAGSPRWRIAPHARRLS